MKMKSNKFITILVFELFVTVNLFISYFLNSNSLLSLTLLAQIIFMFILLLKDTAKNFISLIYLILFCAFLAINPIINIFTERQYIFGEGANFQATLLVLLAAMGLFIGITIGEISDSNDTFSVVEKDDNNYLTSAALMLVCVTAPFALYNTVTNISLVNNFGYVGLYNYADTGIVDRISNFNIAFIYIYLANFPSKVLFKKSLIVIIPLLVFDIFTGRRGNAIINILVLITYIVLRKFVYSNKKIRLSIKNLIVTFIFFVIIAYVSVFISQNRLQESVILSNPIVSFFDETSASFNFIESVYLYENSIRSVDNLYSLQAIFNGSSIFSSLDSILQSLGVSGGQFNHNLGNALAFFRDPVYYKLGGGFGTSYIIEIFIDMGYVAVLIFNALLGFFLSFVNRRKFTNWITLSLILMILRTIYFMPRESTFNWINQIFSFTNLVAILLVWIFSQVIKSVRWNYK